MIEHVVNIESDVELPAGTNQRTIASLLSHILHSEGVDESWHLGVRFVDDVTMQTAHQQFMNIDESTDIMTFPYADEDDIWGESEAGGDLLISVDTARENAAAAEWSLADELYFLIAHGTLHLLGWNDQTVGDRTAMLAHQHVLMAGWTGRP